MRPKLSRRRFLAISAAAVAAAPVQAAGVVRWNGRAFGAPASMILTGLTPHEAAPVVHAVERELARLESVFSLFLRNSDVARLNRTGRLVHPSPDLLAVLRLSGRLWEATGGVFDPTVQPLWEALARGENPRRRDLAIGWSDLRMDGDIVHFARPGMAITLNGVAQGYITDRIAGLLRRSGLTDLVIDMGEIAARGVRPDGRAWQVGIAGTDGVVLRQVSLRNRGLATSAPMGTAMGPDRGTGHIVDPRTAGRAAVHSVASVSADSAAVADGLSTALCLLGNDEAAAAVAGFPDARIEILETA